ncbi:hypothetical protein KKA39_01480 [Patescibacteria group bacterium]|nr:hypothetical protein [Patescibacteria group bacterium]MBU1727963.1 hypothetical protein [Patescibacteria group bacterium]
MIKRASILIFTLILMFFAFLAHAQVQNENVSLEISPKYPKAQEEVKASLSSYTTDLNKSKISWKLNGEVSIEAVGKKDFYFKAGEAGLQTYLEAEIQASDGSFINKKIIITPADMAILWEATDSYVPPFYRGKALLTSEGMVKVVALSNSQNSAGLTYNWKLDGNNKPDSSGYKKNYFIFKNSYLDKDNTIEVTTSSLTGKGVGQGKIIIKPTSPKIVFYQKDPALGVKYERSLGAGFNINPNGSIVVVEPYFFSPKNLDSSDLKFEWSLGEESISTPSPKNELGIRPEIGQSGQSSVGISISNIKKMFLSASKKINAIF